jgi:HK97 family phage major capsid protein
MRTVIDHAAYREAVEAGRFGELAFSVQNSLITTPAGSVPADGGLLRGDLVAGPVPVLGLLDMINIEPTSSDQVSYSYVDAVTSNTTTVGEASTAAAPTAPDLGGALIRAAGGSYPGESGFTMVRANMLVQSIRTQLDLSKKAAQDAPRLQALLDNTLRRMLRKTLEVQLLTGDGVAPNIRGLLATPGVQTTVAGADNPTRAADALAKSVASGGGMPTAIVTSPATYIAKLMDADEHRGGPPTYHKLPVILSDGCPVGKVIVGNFAENMSYFDRQAETVMLSDAFADFYIRGLVCAVAEVRGCMGLTFPASFVSFDAL